MGVVDPFFPWVESEFGDGSPPESREAAHQRCFTHDTRPASMLLYWNIEHGWWWEVSYNGKRQPLQGPMATSRLIMPPMMTGTLAHQASEIIQAEDDRQKEKT